VAEHGALGVNLQLKKSRAPISYLQKPVRTHFAEQHKVRIRFHQYSDDKWRTKQVGVAITFVFGGHVISYS
jgi:hypothetical protein